MWIQINKKWGGRIIGLLSFLFVIHSVYGQIEQEIDILEGVLQKMLKDKKAGYHAGGRVKGIYLDGFGVLFHMKEVSPSQVIYINSMKKNMKEIQEQKAELAKELKALKEQQSQVAKEMVEMQEKILSNAKHEIVIHSNIDIDNEEVEKIEHIFIAGGHDNVVLPYRVEIDEEIKIKEEEAIEHIKAKVTSFLQKYAYTLENLKTNDRVAVMINLDKWQTTDMQDEYLAGWVEYADLQKYKNQKLSADILKSKIQFKLSTDDALSDEIDIMSEILNRSASNSLSAHLSSNSGLYVNGLGVLFFVDYPNQFLWHDKSSDKVHVPIVINTDGANGFVYQTSGKGFDGSSEKMAQAIQNLLFGTVTKYGHTLSIGDDENIVLYVDTDQLYGLDAYGKSVGPMLFQLKMKDLRAYQQGRLSAEQLRQRFQRK